MYAAGAGVIGLIAGFALIPLAGHVLAPAWKAATRLLPMRRKAA